jgi:hypothetical protein
LPLTLFELRKHLEDTAGHAEQKHYQADHYHDPSKNYLHSVSPFLVLVDVTDDTCRRAILTMRSLAFK